ncbi:LysR family transcriptional regulator substrate-binding protein, partial [Pseudacidovorax intermedius]|uniref:LysR family transcriptional regulator substrate-binding protein n=1 Tax=Pseudacidovorax intermedius TaxID=433924 RepID=UPI0005C29B4F
QPIGWAEAAALPLCLLTPEMHNRAIVDAAFAEAGATGVAPAVETNSVLTLVLAVQAGDVCAVLPGAMVDTVRGQPGLLAQPLVMPTVRTPLGFMAPAAVRPSRALEAALGLLQSQEWLSELRAHGGALAA